MCEFHTYVTIQNIYCQNFINVSMYSNNNPLVIDMLTSNFVTFKPQNGICNRVMRSEN